MHEQRSKTPPIVSIIMLTHNSLFYTKQCIQSVFKHTEEDFELILVDNASTDGTREYLQTLPKSKLIINQINQGFARGCNQGMRMASGDYIVLLNNDTVVTKDWLKRLLWHLEHDDSIGIIGPRSNIIVSHQAIIPVSYKSMLQMHEFAQKWSSGHVQEKYQAEQLSGMCMVFRKELIETIGGLDERFSPGYFEDTDFSIRAQISGKTLYVANDVYIHHHGSRSFNINRTKQMQVIQDSKKKFLHKWNLFDLSKISLVVEREKPFNRERHYIPF